MLGKRIFPELCLWENSLSMAFFFGQHGMNISVTRRAQPWKVLSIFRHTMSQIVIYLGNRQLILHKSCTNAHKMVISIRIAG